MVPPKESLATNKSEAAPRRQASDSREKKESSIQKHKKKKKSKYSKNQRKHFPFPLFFFPL